MPTVRRLSRLLWIVVAIAGGVIWKASDRLPADPSDGLVLHGDVRDSLDGATFRVATFNIHGAKGRDLVRDTERIARCLYGVDVAGLQEVHGSFFGHADSQVARVAAHLELAWSFAPTEQRWWSNNFGNGLLTRVRPHALTSIPLLGTQGKKFRNAVFFTFRHRGRHVKVLTTHLDKADDHDAQFDTVSRLFLVLEPPAILLGDLNTKPDHPAMQALLGRPDVRSSEPVNPSPDPPPRIVDWVLFRGLECVRSEYVPTDASDHWPVWADLSLPVAAPPTGE